MTFTDRSQLGITGEQIAQEFLQKEGYRIIKTNYRVRKWGEIDIIGVDQEILAFIEVKTRIGEQMLEPYESVHYRKLTALRRSAERFLVEQSTYDYFKSLPKAYRLDFVSIHYQNSYQAPKIELFKNIEDWH